MDKETMKNLSIETFEQYLDGHMNEAEEAAFFQRLRHNPAMAEFFREYLFVVQGVITETEEKDIEFGLAMKSLSVPQLEKLIGAQASVSQATPPPPPQTQPAPPAAAQSQQPPRFRRNRFRRNFGWITSMAALVVIGLFTVNQVRRSGMEKVDDLIVAYNDLPAPDRASAAEDYIRTSEKPHLEIATADEIETEPGVSHLTENSRQRVNIDLLKRLYHNAPVGDVQAQQDAGMRLAMGYLALHDRKKAVEVLDQLMSRFADDGMFVAKCREIVTQLK